MTNELCPTCGTELRSTRIRGRDYYLCSECNESITPELHATMVSVRQSYRKLQQRYREVVDETPLRLDMPTHIGECMVECLLRLTGMPVKESIRKIRHSVRRKQQAFHGTGQ